LPFLRAAEILPGMAINLPAPIPSGNGKLLDQVRDVIRRKHYSIRTEQTYTDWRVKI
jgi:hypothetical protein